jgi:hypothetical protein
MSDKGSGNIKINEKNGKDLRLIKTIGWNGYWLDGFVETTLCFYSKEESEFGVMERSIKKIFLYSRFERLDFL